MDDSTLHESSRRFIAELAPGEGAVRLRLEGNVGMRCFMLCSECFVGLRSDGVDGDVWGLEAVPEPRLSRRVGVREWLW